MKRAAELRGLTEAPGKLAPTTNGGRRPLAISARWLYGSTKYCGLCDKPAVNVIGGVGVCETHNTRALRIAELAKI